MEVATSIIGLLAVGTKVYMYLSEFTANCVDAPTVAQITCDEVRDFRYALARLKPYVEHSTKITPHGAAVTDINQLSSTLASCVITFSELEKTLDRLLPNRQMAKQMGTVGRLRWTLAGGILSQLVARVQQHKLTLTLLLTIWLSESSSQTEQCLDRLNDTLIQITAGIQPDRPPEPMVSIQEDPSYDSGLAIQTNLPGAAAVNANPSSTTYSDQQDQPGPSFESVLSTSKPYKSMKGMGFSAMSLRSSQKRGTQWSIFSGGSNTSVISLPYTAFQLSGTTIAETESLCSTIMPMKTNKLHNTCWYTTTNDALARAKSSTAGLAGRRKPSLPDPGVLLLRAVESGDIEAMVRAIATGADPSSTGPDGRTPLHLAFTMKHKPLLEALLDRGAHVEERDETGRTLLHHAVQLGWKDMITTLLDRGADIETRDSNGNTSFLLAVLSGDLPMAEMFISLAADVEAKNNDGTHALGFLVAVEDEEIIKKLRDRGSGIGDGARNGSLRLTIRSQRRDIIQKILNRGADIEIRTENGLTPLLISVLDGHEDIVTLLLDSGADVSAKCNQGYSVLHYGATKSTEKLFRLLMDRMMAINMKSESGRTPLHIGAYWGNIDVVRILLACGARINDRCSRGYTPLHEGVQQGEFMVRMLLDRGADLHSKCDRGYTPLHMAAERGAKDVINLLLDRGAQMESKTSEGRTPLHLCVSGGFGSNYEATKLLIARGAAIESRDNDGFTPLHLAAANSSPLQPEIVPLLVQRGALVNSRTKDGQTALHFAAFTYYVQTIKFLLDSGADINSETDEGYTPLCFALSNPTIYAKDIVSVLSDRGGKSARMVVGGRDIMAAATRALFERPAALQN